MQYAYEDRIAELRAKSIAPPAAAARSGAIRPEARPGHAAPDHAGIRATALGAIPDASVTGSIRPPARGAAATDAGTGTPKPSPISDTVIFVALRIAKLGWNRGRP